MPRYNPMAMTKHATLSAVLLIGLLTAACTSASGVSLNSASTPRSSGAAVVATATPEAEATSSKPEVARTQQPLTKPSLGPNQCPAITANPIGCPVLLPPQPIGPQAGHARILVCAQPVAAVVPPITVGASMCGAGFKADELVTITVSGRMGRAAWQVAARPDGTFRSSVPPTACRLLPAYVSARGNRGSMSNAIPLPISVCRPIP